jgi:tRNA(Ile)-lysidine synthase
MREGAQAVLSTAVTSQDWLVVGVSGGPDSLALLHLLVHGGLHPAGKLLAAHLNHQLRPSAGPESIYVRELCRRWGVASRLGTTDVRSLVASDGLSLEEAARTARYRFLAQTAREVGARAVAVGHHADDQAETVLMHFLRGSGLAGLRGMRPVSPMPGAPHLNLLRPLLSATRAEILAYCQAHDIRPVWDESNQDTTFLRNRLRHELLPLLESYNPQIRQRLVHTAEVLAADYELLQELRQEAWSQVLLAQGEGWLRVDLAGWRALPLALQRATLRHAVHTLNPLLRDVTFRPVEAARQLALSGDVGSQAVLPGRMTLTVEYDSWLLALPEADVPPLSLPQLDQVGSLPVPGRFPLANGWYLETVIHDTLPQETIATNPDRWTAYVSLARAGSCVVRGRRLGERFQPLGLAGRSASLKDVMINRKIPADLRPRWPIVANEAHVVWLVGGGIDERVRVRPGEPVLAIHCRRE